METLHSGKNAQRLCKSLCGTRGEAVSWAGADLGGLTHIFRCYLGKERAEYFIKDSLSSQFSPVQECTGHAEECSALLPSALGICVWNRVRKLLSPKPRQGNPFAIFFWPSWDTQDAGHSMSRAVDPRVGPACSSYPTWLQLAAQTPTINFSYFFLGSLFQIPTTHPK